LFLRIAFCIAAAVQEAEERFVGRIPIHLFKNVIDIREKVATAQVAVTEAPQIAGNFGDPDISRLKTSPYLRREPVDKLGAKLNGSLADWIPLREHPATDAVARLENSDGKTGSSQLSGSRKSRRSCADHDDVGKFRHNNQFR
jgi:hypothetical protein